jgi:hypothetical protein
MGRRKERKEERKWKDGIWGFRENMREKVRKI